MIEVACSKCGKKYRVDEEKIKKDTAKSVSYTHLTLPTN